jgi:hypothetical protein
VSEARRAIREAREAMQRRPAFTLGAVAAFAGSSLVLAAASRASALALRAAAGEGGMAPRAIARALANAPQLVLRAWLTLMVGIALAALMADVARMCALCAYSGSRTPLLHGLSRTPVLITVRAVELTVSFMLLSGGAMTVIRLPELPPLHAALAATAIMGPVLALVALNFAAARVGIALAVRGLRPAPSLIHGYDVALRRLPSLVALLLRIAFSSLPLWLAAGVLRLFAAGVAPRVEVIFSAAAAACLGAAVLWAYASLVAWVGRDARLAGG